MAEQQKENICGIKDNLLQEIDLAKKANVEHL
jgi:hypothetical protein